MSYLAEVQNSLKAIKPELKRKFHVSTIGLFGSVVREDFSPTKSDIDIMVDFSTPVGIEFITLADYLEKHFGRKVDLVSRKGVKSAYLAEIEKDLVYV
jgi:predicted nucleotidyltransferase